MGDVDIPFESMQTLLTWVGIVVFVLALVLSGSLALTLLSDSIVSTLRWKRDAV